MVAWDVSEPEGAKGWELAAVEAAECKGQVYV